VIVMINYNSVGWQGEMASAANAECLDQL